MATSLFAVLLFFSPNSSDVLVYVADELFVEHIQSGPPLIEDIVCDIDRSVTDDSVPMPVCD